MASQKADDGNESRDFTSVVLAQIGRLDGAIEKEFTLISDRMTWTLISESFILGAFSACVINYEIKKSLCLVILSLILTLPILGFMIAAVASKAINAALLSAERLKNRREDLERYFEGAYQVNLVSAKFDVHLIGNIPPRYLPICFMLLWPVYFFIAILQLISDQTFVTILISGILILAFLSLIYLIYHLYIKQVSSLEKRIEEVESRLPAVKKPNKKNSSPTSTPP